MRNLTLDAKRALLLLRYSLRFALMALARRIFSSRGSYTYAVELRYTMEKMGLTYLKLGQYLAMRFDVLPEEVCNELSKLFEDVNPLSFAEVKQAIEKELKGPIERVFANFEERPMAAASVAQVHKARTLNGEAVAVKVQRPGIDVIFDSDMRILGALASLSDYLHLGGELSTKDVFDQFERWTRRELNFVVEGKTADRLRESATPHEIVPYVFWNLTTQRILTMELIDGISMGQIAKLLDQGGLELVRKLLPNIDIDEALHNLSDASLHQLFITGFFHGDPHPGNILVQRDNSVAFVDFGIFGQLSGYQRDLLSNHIENLALGNIKESFRYYMELGYSSESTDMRAFEQEGEAALRRWYQSSRDVNTSQRERHLGGVSGEIMAVVRRHQYLINADTMLFWRAINALDSTALRLSPTFDLLKELRTFFQKIRPGPVERLYDLYTDQDVSAALFELQNRLPNDLNNVLTDLTRGYYPGTFVFEESARENLINNNIARAVSCAVIGLSFAVLSTAKYIPGWYRVVFSVVAVFLLILSLIKARLK